MEPKDVKTPEVYTILTPLPQLILKEPIRDDLKDVLLKSGFCFSPMTPQLYRNLVNIAKDKQCSDEVISLLQDTLENGAIFWAKIPTPMPVAKLPLLSGVIYSSIADEILQRLFNCLLLFANVPKPFRRSFWIFANGTPEQIDTNTLALLDPGWNYYDWEIKYAEPEYATKAIILLSITGWDRIAPVANIDKLNQIFINKDKQEFYNKSGKENILKKAEEIIKSRYGQDAHLMISDIPDITAEYEVHEITDESNKKEVNPDNPTKISHQQSAKWFIQGWQNEYFKEIDKLTSKLKSVSGQRFIRAFQFFTDACRMSNPHKFVALTTPLETIFSSTHREITFQLSSRIAWFLEPDDFDKRNILFNAVQELYDTRSAIIHGDKYDSDKVEKTVWDLEDLNRKVFLKILSCEPIYKKLFDKDPTHWEQYLNGLNLGISQEDKKE